MQKNKKKKHCHKHAIKHYNHAPYLSKGVKECNNILYAMQHYGKMIINIPKTMCTCTF